MSDNEQWNIFAMTGKVEDYLSYRSNAGSNVTDRSDSNDRRDCYTDRDDINRISDERVR